MKQNYLSAISMVVALLIFIPALQTQTTTYKSTKSLKVVHMDKSIPLRDMQIFNKKRSMVEAKEINNKFDFREDPNMDPKWEGTDPVVQDYTVTTRSSAPSVVQVIPGASNDDNVTVNGLRVAPPDTQGDVGPNHYAQMVNLMTTIYNKDGSVALGPFPSSNIWSGFTDGIILDFGIYNHGDPIVVYDEYEDRWIFSHFVTGPYYMLIAISATPDPTGPYHRYAISYLNFPDYPKLGVWNDGVYITVNEFNGSFLGSSLVGFPKAGYYDGDPIETLVDPFYFFMDDNIYPSYGSWLPADADGPTPPPNSTHYSICRSYGMPNTLHVLTIVPDWTTDPATFTHSFNDLTVAPYFTSDYIVSQPNGQNLHSLGDRLMYRLQYRDFGTHQAMVANHSVQLTSGGNFGIRWYELRAPSGSSTWSIDQQGTFKPADGENRWMGSIAMNGNGDIALGYSLASFTTYPSIYFTGQSAGATGTGVMDLTETLIHAGTQSQFGTHRWGDYSMMSVDPSDDETFWYTQEHAISTDWGGWDTKIAEIDLNIAGGPAMIAVTPASLTFNVLTDGSDSDLLNIANTAVAGSADLNWTITMAEPPPPMGMYGIGNSDNPLLGSSSQILAPEIPAQRQVVADESSYVENADPTQDGAKATVRLDPDFQPPEPMIPTMLYDNGPFVNSAGTGVGGADESVLQDISLGMNVYGFGHQFVNDNRVADDFTVTDPSGWQIDEFEFYAYESYAGNTSTITGLYYEIWDGDPSNPSSNIVYGDMVTNRFVSSTWTNVYRVLETTSGTNSDRAIMASKASANIILGPGTYWIVWQSQGSDLYTGPWAPAITINGQTSTGNGIQYISSSGTWGPLIDIGPQGLPFKVYGNTATVACPWLSVAPTSGTTLAGSDDNVTVSVDATGLSDGVYDCELNISSNASNASTVTVPVTMVVGAECPITAHTLPYEEGFENQNGIARGDGSVCGPTYYWSFDTDHPGQGRASYGTYAYMKATGTGAITMDRNPSGDNTINYAILTINLSNYASATDLELSFSYADHTDESGPNDKVWIRGNLSDAWILVTDLDPGNMTDDVFQTVSSIDIDNILGSATPAQAVGPSTQVRFGQEGTDPAGSDGITFDDITIQQQTLPCPIPPITLPYFEGFELVSGSSQNSGVSCFSNFIWEYQTSIEGEGRLRYGINAYQMNTGIGAATLDRNPAGDVVTNYLIVTLNMLNYTSSSDLELAFSYAEHGDEGHINDKVWIRGSIYDNWVDVYDLQPDFVPSDTYYDIFGLDIDATLAAAMPPQTVSGSFQIRFGQEDNFPTGTDGISFDDISIIENSGFKNSEMIANEDQDGEISVYAHQQSVFIRSTGDMAEAEKEVWIYDMLGRTLVQTKLLPSVLDQLKVDAKGSLIVRVLSGETITTEKVMVR